MSADPLSEVVALSGARCTVTRCMEIDGAWHFRFAAPAGIKFIAVTHGHCWLAMEPVAPRELQAGDVFMLRGDHSFDMATNLDLPSTNGNGVFTATGPSGSGPGAEFQAICGHVAIDRESGRLLVEALPPLIVVDRGASEAPTTEWMLHQLIRELNGERPGHALALEQLSQLIFIQMIRSHIVDNASSPIGWIAALGDDRIAGALRLIHGAPAKAWKVEDLAAHAGLSRTAFATRFSAALGIGPATYLSDWRMHLAERELWATSSSVAAIARSVGFASVSAFSVAFRLRFGVSPRHYRERRDEAAIARTDFASALPRGWATAPPTCALLGFHDYGQGRSGLGPGQVVGGRRLAADQPTAEGGTTVTIKAPRAPTLRRGFPSGYRDRRR